MDKSKIFLDFINKFTDIDGTQKAEAFSLFSQIIQNDESKYPEVEAFMDDCEVFNGYEFEDLMENLKDILFCKIIPQPQKPSSLSLPLSPT